MDIYDSIIMALSAIRANKLRSILTLLGIVVGVFSIIAVMTSMNVLQNSIESGLSSLGSNTFQVQKMPVMMAGGPEERRKYRNRKNLTFEQGIAVKERSTLARYVGIEAWQGGKTVRYKDKSTNPNVSVCGETPDGFPTNNWIIKDGRIFTEQEVSFGKNVAVLGASVVEKLFTFRNPIGEEIKIDGVKYEIIGILEKQGTGLGRNPDNFVAIPITTLFRVYGRERSVNIMVQAKSRELYNPCIDEVIAILRNIRKVPPGKENDFEIFSNDSLINQFNQFTFYLKLGIGLISAIALIAAGVGIMNIMLVSVMERTREIGIRKAIGAKRRDILLQFIIEAVVLCEIGGLIGVIVGVAGGNISAIILKIPGVIPYDWVLIGLFICSLVGIIFGVYPAWKASSLDPIESLRYE